MSANPGNDGYYRIYFQAFNKNGDYLGSGCYGKYKSLELASREAKKRFSVYDKIYISKSDPFKMAKLGRRIAFTKTKT